jgi:hypothetical protein
LQRGAQTIRCVVARAEMAGRDPRQRVCEHREFGCKHRCDDAMLCSFEHLMPAGPLTGKVAPRLFQRVQTGSVHQNARNHVQPLIAGRAVHARKAWHRLVLAENLLDDQVKCRIETCLLAQLANKLCELACVAGRLAQAVNVIEPQAL